MVPLRVFSLIGSHSRNFVNTLEGIEPKKVNVSYCVALEFVPLTHPQNRSCYLSRVLFKVCDKHPVLLYSVYHGLAPKSICNLFHKTEPRRYHLRRVEGFNVPKYNYSIGRTSLSYRGPTAWNILPESYKLIDSYASFKQKMKNNLAPLNKLSFDKESCLSTNKNADFYYF